MAGSVSTTTSYSGLPKPTPWLDASRQDALQRSSDMLRDRLVKTGSTLTQVNTTFGSANVDTFSRGTSIAYASRELTQNLRTMDSLQEQLGVVMGNSPTYQAVVSSSSGKAFFGTVRAAAATIGPVADSAASIADLARTQGQAIRDFGDMQRVLSDSNASTVLKVASTAKATQSAAAFVQQQQKTLRTLQQADADYLSNPAYQKLTADMRDNRSLRVLSKLDSPFMAKAVGMAQVAGTIGGVVAGTITLPTMIRSIGTTYGKLKSTLDDPNASDSKRLDALADLSRATAGTIQNVNGLRMGIEGLGEMASASTRFGGFLQGLHLNGTLVTMGSWFTRIMKVLSPIADVSMLVADLVKLRTVFTDPTATIGGKFRAILNVGLDGLKMASWVMPGAQFLRMAYVGASVVQLGVAVWDFGGHLIPAAVASGNVMVNSVTNPPSVVKDLATSLGAGLEMVGHGVYASAAALAWGVAHPLEAIKAINTKVHDAFTGAQEVGGVMKNSAALVNRNLPKKPATDAPAANAPAAASPPAS